MWCSELPFESNEPIIRDEAIKRNNNIHKVKYILKIYYHNGSPIHVEGQILP
jgi:hypothetical protein